MVVFKQLFTMFKSLCSIIQNIFAWQQKSLWAHGFRTIFKVFIIMQYRLNILSGNPYWRGRLITDLIVLTSLDQLLFILKILFTFATKQTSLKRASSALSPIEWKHFYLETSGGQSSELYLKVVHFFLHWI